MKPLTDIKSKRDSHTLAEFVVVVLSDDDRKIFEFVNFVTICGLVALFGMTANIINIIIFYKQGLANTVNIAFIGLAFSDLCCLLALEWSCICLNPLLPVYDITWVSAEVMYLTGAWPHICFSRITSYITVYITAERFISIAWPLKVKQIVTATRTTATIFVIYIVNIMTFISEYATSYLDWRFVPEKNTTLVGIIFTSNRNDFEGLCCVLHSLFSVTSFVAVIIFTVALVVKLTQSSQWRKVASTSITHNVSTSSKERRTVKMIVLIAIILIICYTPGSIIAMTTFIVGPEFDVKGKYLNICESVWSFACIFQSINSSVNIFLYYKMSSKYRQTFDETVFKWLKCIVNDKSNI